MQIPLKKSWVKGVVLLVLILLSLWLRLSMSQRMNTDLLTFLSWYDKIVAGGGLQAIRDPFYSYSPPYLYLISLATLTQSFLPKIVAVKGIAVVFDLISAIFMFHLIKLNHPENNLPWIGFLCVLYLPVVFLGSGYWGQCDSIYTAFLLGSLFFACQQRYIPATILITSAFAFKLQAIFLAPLFLLFFLNGEFNWKALLLIPVTYLGWMIPALAVGCPLWQTLSTYTSQTSSFHSFSMHAPNLYVFLSNTNYDQLVVLFSLIAVSILLFFAIYAHYKAGNLGLHQKIFLAVFFTTLAPFILPGMHERYLYPAAVFSIAFLFYFPELRMIPLILQTTTLLSYTPFLIHREILPMAVPALLNFLLVAWLIQLFFKEIIPQSSNSSFAPNSNRLP